MDLLSAIKHIFLLTHMRVLVEKQINFSMNLQGQTGPVAQSTGRQCKEGTFTSMQKWKNCLLTFGETGQESNI